MPVFTQNRGHANVPTQNKVRIKEHQWEKTHAKNSSSILDIVTNTRQHHHHRLATKSVPPFFLTHWLWSAQLHRQHPYL